MGIVTGMLKLFFGTKSEKDRKEIEPYVEKIKAVYPLIEQLTNDELRARSAALQAAIAQHIAGDRSTDRRIEGSTGERRHVARRQREYIAPDRPSDRGDRPQNRGETRRNPARSVRYHERYGPPFCTEQRDRSDRDRFRPQPGRRKGLRPYRRRQSHLQ